MAASPRRRAALVASIVTLVLVVLLSLTARSIVLSGFGRIEQDAAVRNIERVGEALRVRMSVLQQVARDRGGWDDTYDYLANRSPDYVDANLTPDTLTNLNVSFMYLFDGDRRVVRAAGVDTQRGVSIPAPDALTETVTGSENLFNFATLRSTRSGILRTSDGVVLAASSPITDSSFVKPEQGTIVVVRPLDARLVDEIAHETRLDITIAAPSKTRSLTASRGMRFGGSGGRVRVFGISDSRMIGLWRVEDVHGVSAMTLEVDMTRDVWQQGLAISDWLTLAIVLFGVVVVLAVIGIVDRRMISISRAELRQAVAEGASELAESESRYRNLVDHMAEGLLAMDSAGIITFSNREADRIFGVETGGLLGSCAYDLLAEEDVRERVTAAGSVAAVASVDASVERGDTRVPVQITVTAAQDGSMSQWLIRDITSQRRYEQQLVHLATHDYLTGLMNRRHFEQELEREVARAVRTGRGGGVLWLDLDEFKAVNDTLGHPAGDELLTEVANFLMAHTRGSGVVSRIGGDEFAVLLAETSAAEVEAAIRRLLEEMAQQTFIIGDGEAVTPKGSIGGVVFPDHGCSTEELMSRADVAMYEAKSQHSGYCIWSQAGMGDEAHGVRLEWSERIRRALKGDGLVVHAQPIVSVATGETVAYELFMRLAGQEPGKLHMPDEFLPIAERLGLIRELDRAMVSRALEIARAHPEVAMINVNLSSRMFDDTRLLDTIDAEFKRTGVDPHRLGFELTESAALADIQCAHDLICGLRWLGCRVLLDDFGTGFSSFYYLRHLPVDAIKIDGAFITKMTISDKDRHLVLAMVELAKALGLETVAECVEDESSMRLIEQMGVTCAQGYHIARPLPLEDHVLSAARSDA